MYKEVCFKLNLKIVSIVLIVLIIISMFPTYIFATGQTNNVSLSKYTHIIYADGTNGNDTTGDGSETNPYKTFIKAYNSLIDSTSAIFIKNSVTIGQIGTAKTFDVIGNYLKYKSTLTGNTISISNMTGNFYDIALINNNDGYTKLLYNDNVNFYNCVIFDNKNSYSIGYYGTYNFYNCVILSMTNIYSLVTRKAIVTFQNCDFVNGFIGSPSTTITCLTLGTVDSDYRITSGGWQNTGTGTNIDGTKANIGVYGGLYSWDAVTLSIPTINSNYSSNSNSATFSWSLIENATSYEISIDNGTPIDVGNVTTYTQSNLQPNSSHTYKVKAKCNTNASDWSLPITIYTSPSNVAIDNISSTNNSITVNWNAIDGVSGYDINISKRGYDNTISVSQVTNYTINNLIPNTQYNIRVRSKNAYALGEWSNISSIYTKTDVPNINNFSSTSNSVTLNWNTISGANSYELSIDNGTPFDLGNINSYTHNNLQANDSHIYKIRSKNSNGNSDWSEPLTVYTTAIEPEKVLVNTSQESVKMSINNDINPVGTLYNFAIFQNNILIKDTGFIENNGIINDLVPNEAYDIKVATKSINGTITSFKTLGNIIIPDNKTSKGDLDVSVIVDPTITLTLNTNSINFGNVSTLTTYYELPNILNIGIQSNNIYTLSAIAKDDFIGIKGSIMSSSLLNIKEHNSNYQSLNKGVKTDLISNQAPTSGVNYNIDLKLNTDYNAKPDTYSNIINIAVSQL